MFISRKREFEHTKKQNMSNLDVGSERKGTVKIC